MLVATPSADEIKAAVFILGSLSAPGPDGFSGIFFQHSWEVVGRDVCFTVRDFFLLIALFRLG